jgi:hypothetical protein
VDLSSVTSQVSYVAEVSGFAARDRTLVWSGVLVHVFPVWWLVRVTVLAAYNF